MMTTPDQLDDYAFAGFVMTRPFAWRVDIYPSYPEVFAVSLSSCRAELFPGVWTLGWSKDARAGLVERAGKFGCPPQRADALCTAANEALQRGALASWHVMQSVDTVHTLRAFLPSDTDLRVFGFGLHRHDVARLASVLSRESAPPPCLSEVLLAHRPFPHGGTPLGFELLVADETSMDGHSWLCNGLDAALFAEQSNVMSAFHLVAPRELAVHTADSINRDGRAEPGLWLPWLLVDYTQLFAAD